MATHGTFQADIVKEKQGALRAAILREKLDIPLLQTIRHNGRIVKAFQPKLSLADRVDVLQVHLKKRDLLLQSPGKNGIFAYEQESIRFSFHVRSISKTYALSGSLRMTTVDAF